MSVGLRVARCATDTSSIMIDPVTNRLFVAQTFAPLPIAPIARVAGGGPPMPEPRATDRYEASSGNEPAPQVTYGTRRSVYPGA